MSVVASKGLYYGAKFVLLEAALLDGGLVSTLALPGGVLAIVVLGGAMVHRLRTRSSSLMSVSRRRLLASSCSRTAM